MTDSYEYHEILLKYYEILLIYFWNIFEIFEIKKFLNTWLMFHLITYYTFLKELNWISKLNFKNSYIRISSGHFQSSVS